MKVTLNAGLLPTMQYFHMAALQLKHWNTSSTTSVYNPLYKKIRRHPSPGELFPTWRHSCNSWGLQSELPAVTVRTDRPPGPPRWASGLSSRSPCCGWWTRPSEPAAERASKHRGEFMWLSGTIWSRKHLQRDVRVSVIWVRSGEISSGDLRPKNLAALTYCCFDSITCCAFTSENSNTGVKEHHPNWTSSLQIFHFQLLHLKVPRKTLGIRIEGFNFCCCF